MKIIEAKGYQDMSRKAAEIIAAQVTLFPASVIGLATGATPVGTYERLVEKYKAGDLDFSGITTVNLDEYVGLKPDNDQSYRYYMDTWLFDHINVDKSRIHVPNGVASDLVGECARYEALIERLNGIDLQLLGLGLNGHIGFNEPAEEFVKPPHIVEITESTITANTRFFGNIDDVPRRAITMGMKSIMGAKKILLIVNGSGKKEIFERSLYGPVTPLVPASVLQLHRDLTVVMTFDG
jgi:glucosamine-6-phosphate deaminase